MQERYNGNIMHTRWTTFQDFGDSYADAFGAAEMPEGFDYEPWVRRFSDEVTEYDGKYFRLTEDRELEDEVFGRIVGEMMESI